jgi:Flp pilus assembly protein TadD
MGRARDGLLFIRSLEAKTPAGGASGAAEAARPGAGPPTGQGKRQLGLGIAEGLLLTASGDAAGAERAFRRALTLDPTSVLAMQELFALYDAAGRAAELEPDLRAALRREPGSGMHHNWLGLVLRRKGDLDGAERALRRALEAVPDLVGAMANLGSLHLQQARYADAVLVLRRALAKDPRNVESRTNLIVALGLTRDLEGARALVDEAATLGQRTPLYHNAMAYALHVNGRHDEALAEIRRSLEIDPRQPDALKLRAEIEGGDPARGLPYR